MPETWQVNVSRSSATVLVPRSAIFKGSSNAGPRLEKSWALQLRVEPGTCSKKLHLISKQVVSLQTVATARTDQTVVPVDINCLPAKRASIFSIENGSTKPPLNRGAKVRGADVFA